jgi:predicted membrane metal-binding protein
MDEPGAGTVRILYFHFVLFPLSILSAPLLSFLFISLISLSLFSPFALVLFFDFLPFSARSDYHPFPHLFL